MNPCVSWRRNTSKDPRKKRDMYLGNPHRLSNSKDNYNLPDESKEKNVSSLRKKMVHGTPFVYFYLFVPGEIVCKFGNSFQFVWVVYHNSVTRLEGSSSVPTPKATTYSHTHSNTPFTVSLIFTITKEGCFFFQYMRRILVYWNIFFTTKNI